jgi:hypothetical protein
MDVGVVATHDELEPPLIGDDQAGERGLAAELLQARLGLLRGGAAELLVLVALDHRQQPLAFERLAGDRPSIGAAGVVLAGR